MDRRQQVFFEDLLNRVLPTVGEQRDIVYYATTARNVLNGPETTGMGYWSVNPYVGCAFGCAYCYARYAHRYTMERAAADEKLSPGLARDVAVMPPWLAFERRIFVKQNAPTKLSSALRHGTDRYLGLIRGQSLVIGTATDPYQPAERRFRITRGILEALAEHPGLRIGIITKSPLITRDIDVLKRLSRHSRLKIHVSLITVDRDLARRIEPRAPTPESRLRAVRRLREAELNVGVNVMPVLPGITDAPASLNALVERIAETGATHLNAGSLRLQAEARKRYLPFITQEFPHLADRYHRTFSHSSNVGERYQAGLRRFFKKTCAAHGIRLGDERRDAEGTFEDDTNEPNTQLHLSL